MKDNFIITIDMFFTDYNSNDDKFWLHCMRYDKSGINTFDSVHTNLIAQFYIYVICKQKHDKKMDGTQYEIEVEQDQFIKKLKNGTILSTLMNREEANQDLSSMYGINLERSFREFLVKKPIYMLSFIKREEVPTPVYCIAELKYEGSHWRIKHLYNKEGTYYGCITEFIRGLFNNYDGVIQTQNEYKDIIDGIEGREVYLFNEHTMCKIDKSTLINSIPITFSDGFNQHHLDIDKLPDLLKSKENGEWVEANGNDMKYDGRMKYGYANIMMHGKLSHSHLNDYFTHTKLRDMKYLQKHLSTIFMSLAFFLIFIDGYITIDIEGITLYGQKIYLTGQIIISIILGWSIVDNVRVFIKKEIDKFVSADNPISNGKPRLLYAKLYLSMINEELFKCCHIEEKDWYITVLILLSLFNFKYVLYVSWFNAEYEKYNVIVNFIIHLIRFTFAFIFSIIPQFIMLLASVTIAIIILIHTSLELLIALIYYTLWGFFSKKKINEYTNVFKNVFDNGYIKNRFDLSNLSNGGAHA